MAAKKGTMPPNAGKGRKPGSKNKFGIEVKNMVEQALTKAGGVDYLLAQAHDNPRAFLTLVAKLMPQKIDAEVTLFAGDDLVERLQQGRAAAAQLIAQNVEDADGRAVH